MNLKQKLQNIGIPQENIYIEEMMSKYTSFKIGGKADCLVKIKKLEELKNIIVLAKRENIPVTIIGNGTNLLVTDKGIRGITIKIEMDKMEIDGNNIIVGAGAKIAILAQKALQNALTGFEELAGIPGTVGGAIYMNAGAYQKEMKDVIVEVTCIDYNGNVLIFSKEEAQFEYRSSIFAKEKYIIVEAKIMLQKGNEEAIKEKMDGYKKARIEKQPIEYPNAGSIFKRGNDFITAKLIDEAGLKGLKVGGAEVSLKHAGFIINTGNATAKDVMDLYEKIKEEVYRKFEKKLELELEIIGEK